MRQKPAGIDSVCARVWVRVGRTPRCNHAIKLDYARFGCYVIISSFSKYTIVWRAISHYSR